jgi:hypothetical protein
MELMGPQETSPNVQDPQKSASDTGRHGGYNHMAKKFSLLMAAVAILAFAIPSFANASQLTNSAGVPTSMGTKIIATSTSPTVTLTGSLLGDLSCEHVTLEGELTVNSGGTVEVAGIGEGTQSGCTRSGKPITFSDTTVTNIRSTMSGTGTASFVSTAMINTIVCHFTGVNVPFTYTSGSDTIVFSGARGVLSTGCGAARLDGTFTLEREGGGTLIFD